MLLNEETVTSDHPLPFKVAAALSGDYRVALSLVDLKADVNRDAPVLIGAQEGHVEFVLALLEAGASTNCRTAGGENILHLLATVPMDAKRAQVLKCVADRCVDLHQPRPADGATPLDVATKARNPFVRDVLSAAGGCGMENFGAHMPSTTKAVDSALSKTTTSPHDVDCGLGRVASPCPPAVTRKRSLFGSFFAKQAEDEGSHDQTIMAGLSADPVGSLKKLLRGIDLDAWERLSILRGTTIGRDATILVPDFWDLDSGIVHHHEMLLQYCDWTAGGRASEIIEKYMRSVLNMFANTHTETSATGLITTQRYRSACDAIRTHVGGGHDAVVIPAGAGATGAIQKLMMILGLYCGSSFRALTGHFGGDSYKPPDSSRVVVLTTYQEHHSNDISWADSSWASHERIPMREDLSVDLEWLGRRLGELAAQGAKVFLSLSACSNVTGMRTDLPSLTTLGHAYGALCFADYAAAGPYVRIDMERDGLDAIFLSPHKNLGGPGSCGVLVMKRHVHPGYGPSFSGGGTVLFVSPWKRLYLEGLADVETAGTPPIKGMMQAALAFQLKEWAGYPLIESVERFYCRKTLEFFKQNRFMNCLGSLDPSRRLPIFSFTVLHGNQGRMLHHNFVAALLNDLCGVQVRSGCACAGPYGNLLFRFKEEDSSFYADAAQRGWTVLKPGFSRFNVHYTTSWSEFQFLLFSLDIVSHFGGLFLSEYVINWASGACIHAKANPKRQSFSFDEAVQYWATEKTKDRTVNRDEDRNALLFKNVKHVARLVSAKIVSVLDPKRAREEKQLKAVRDLILRQFHGSQACHCITASDLEGVFIDKVQGELVFDTSLFDDMMWYPSEHHKPWFFWSELQVPHRKWIIDSYAEGNDPLESFNLV